MSTQPSAPPGREQLLPQPALESCSFGPETADTWAAVTWPARGLLAMALLQVCTGAVGVSSQAQGSHVAPQAHRSASAATPRGWLRCVSPPELSSLPSQVTCLFPSVVASGGCSSKVPRAAGDLLARVWGPSPDPYRWPKLRCWQGCARSRRSRGESSACLTRFLGARSAENTTSSLGSDTPELWNLLLKH